MDWQLWLTLGVVLLAIAGMLWGLAGPGVLIGSGLCLLAVTGVLTPAETLAGFANPALATIAALFVLSAGLRETGVLDRWVAALFARSRSETAFLASLCPPLAGMSALLNNAPIVASVTPVVLDWTRRHGLSPSRFLIPLSYATVLGSSITLIGTSVNLTVAGLLPQSGLAPMGLFELAPVGIPVCAAGLLYVAVGASRGLPVRRETAVCMHGERREYVASMRVRPHCPLAGQSVLGGGLRNLPGLDLIEIDRGDRTITPVAPTEVIEEGDELSVAGVVSTIVDLQRIPGLEAIVHADSPGAGSAGERLVEAVVSSSSPLLHRSIRDAGFRTVYDAAVVAVHRNGELLSGNIGEIVTRPGDTLLLQADAHFVRVHGNSPDFFLVSELGETARRPGGRAWLAVVGLVAMICVVALGWLPASVAAVATAGMIVASGCLAASTARRSIDGSVLLVIGGGFGLALAMEKTGAATALAELLTGSAGPFGAFATLVAVYAATLLLAELLHHAAAAALMVPVAVSAAAQVGAEPRGFVFAVAIAATCAFANPATYQTHLIVYGPGGYRFGDFVRFGLPLDLVAAVVALSLIPVVWPL